MKKVIWTTIKVVPVLLGALGIVATVNPAKASDLESLIKSDQKLTKPLQANKSGKTIATNLESDGLEQITSVSELRDVAPTEWAYEALRSLVERYGCIVGYPDRTFRGNKPLSRWEFAAGLNACMNVMERLIQEGSLSKEDIEKLKRLAQEFRAELAALGARVDNLEGRVSFLENHQFSTTTKLQGEVIFSVANAFGSNSGNSTLGTWRNPAGGKPGSFGGQAVLTNRVRLNFLTSFTGNDQLRVRLQAGNGGGTNSFQTATGVPAARLAYDDGFDNSVTIDDLFYRFSAGNLTVLVGANQLNLDDVFDTYNPYLSSSGTGSLSRAQRYNSIVYSSSSDGTGLALKYKFLDQFALTLAYLARSSSANNPIEGSGLFNGSFSAGAQIDLTANKDFKFGITYVHTYDRTNPNLFTVGSPVGNDPFRGTNAPISSDRIGLQTSWNITNFLNFSAWGGAGRAQGQSSDLALQYLNSDFWGWNASLSVLDVFKEGAVLSFSGGLLPSSFGVFGLDELRSVPVPLDGGTQDRNSSYMIQAQYAFPLTNNIQITPGAYVIFNPNNFAANTEVWVAVLRTTFTF